MPLLLGGLIVGLLTTLSVVAWPAIINRPLSMFDSFWAIGATRFDAEHYGKHFGYAGFLLASLFTSLSAVLVGLLLSWLTALGLQRIAQGTWFREVLIDLLHVLSAIPPIAIGGAVALWVLPLFLQSTGSSGPCYLLAIIALVGIHWPRLTLRWVELLESLPPNLTTQAREMGASRWHTLRWVLWPATKHRIADIALGTIVRCLGDAVGIIFVCGLSSQTVFQIDLLGNTDTLATRLLSTETDWFGPHRDALAMVTLALAIVCLLLSVLRWRLSHRQPVMPLVGVTQHRRTSGQIGLVVFGIVLLCYLVPLLLAGHVAMEYGSTLKGPLLLRATLWWVWLALGGTSLACLLAYLSGWVVDADRMVRWLNACPPMVWAIGFSCLLPNEWRNVGLLLALALVQWPVLAKAIGVIQRRVPDQPQHFSQRLSAVLMSLACAVGELNILAYQSTPFNNVLLGDLALSRSIPHERVAIVILLAMSLVLAVTSRLILRILTNRSAAE